MVSVFRAYGELAPDAEQPPDHRYSIRATQLSLCLSILYFLVECGRRQLQKGEGESIRRAFSEIDDLIPGIELIGSV